MKKSQQEKKGKHSYDSEKDILYIKVDDAFYDHSLEFNELVVDFDKNGRMSGIRLFDASEMLQIEKEILEKIKECKLEKRVRENIITIHLKLAASNGESEITHTYDFVKECTTPLGKTKECVSVV